jgi:hypothetical protein
MSLAALPPEARAVWIPLIGTDCGYSNDNDYGPAIWIGGGVILGNEHVAVQIGAGGPIYIGGRHPYERGQVGKVKTDIKPEKATVYVDGEPAGTADDFNGYPGKLVLSEGKHVLTFVCPGYETYAVELDIIPYQNYNLKYKMKKLTGADAEMGAPPGVPKNPKQNWEPVPPPPPPKEKNVPGICSDYGTLILQVYPYEASVYLDGTFRRVSEFGMAIKIPHVRCGNHTLEVVKPGYKPFKQEIEVRESEELALKISLERETP